MSSKIALRVGSLGYLTIILLAPLVMMFWRTFQDLGGAWDAFTQHSTLLAFKLTLEVTAIAVPLNTIFGVICALAIERGVIPPTINLDNPDEGCDLDYVPHVARETRVNRAMSNSFGFGGHNASLLIGRYQPS